jgi:hypothetical protein
MILPASSFPNIRSNRERSIINQELKIKGTAPKEAMKKFADWIEGIKYICSIPT